MRSSAGTAAAGRGSSGRPRGRPCARCGRALLSEHICVCVFVCARVSPNVCFERSLLLARAPRRRACHTTIRKDGTKAHVCSNATPPGAVATGALSAASQTRERGFPGLLVSDPMFSNGFLPFWKKLPRRVSRHQDSFETTATPNNVRPPGWHIFRTNSAAATPGRTKASREYETDVFCSAWCFQRSSVAEPIQGPHCLTHTPLRALSLQTSLY